MIAGHIAIAVVCAVICDVVQAWYSVAEGLRRLLLAAAHPALNV